MRKIEQQMLNAIANKRNFNTSNTRVEYIPETSTPMRSCIEHAKIYLFNNHIGTYVYSRNKCDYNRQTFALWPTRTTKSRLRALGAI